MTKNTTSIDAAGTHAQLQTIPDVNRQPPVDRDLTTLRHLSLSSPTAESGSNQTANDAPPRPQPTSNLTSHVLAIHDKAFNHSLYTAQTIARSVDLQKAAVDLGIDLPLHCYMPDRSQLDGWVHQQSK
ncbi:hypothetical protein BDW02DRAFT_568604 [Decorospora gaudefroyi]|uniref:Uncharacterized protein n=1 Tax=Decorospora gaudefroyi TaxID=184978 RepID=A0A6A5KMZ5_9PLEO|nr:hypothetical protein BDW02DRAFT_568604 [Decorospora gaudefroyi]